MDANAPMHRCQLELWLAIRDRQPFAYKCLSLQCCHNPAHGNHAQRLTRTLVDNPRTVAIRVRILISLSFRILLHVNVLHRKSDVNDK